MHPNPGPLGGHMNKHELLEKYEAWQRAMDDRIKAGGDVRGVIGAIQRSWLDACRCDGADRLTLTSPSTNQYTILVYLMSIVYKYWDNPKGFAVLKSERFRDEVIVNTLGVGNLKEYVEKRVAVIKKADEPRGPSIELFSALSRRESEVLVELCHGNSVAEIAENSFISVGTVRTQVKAILRKLDVNSQAKAVALAYRSGWQSA